MNEARIALYLDLIQRLLSCSGGEQRAILQGQRELWDEESLWTLQEGRANTIDHLILS